MSLEGEVRKVDSKASFIAFVKVLRHDFVDNKDEWTNRTVDRYLDGIAGWMGEYDIPESDTADGNWHAFANILWAASEYENRK